MGLKIIYPEKQGTITATSSDANYLATNLEDSKIKKVWRAASGVQTATLRVPITAGADAVALYGTNAESAICTITLDSAEKNLLAQAAANEGGGLVGIPCTSHGYSEGAAILLYGTTNYDGPHTLPSQAAGNANKIIITAAYVAETFGASDVVCAYIETETHTLDTGTRVYDRFWQEYTQQAAAHTATIQLTAGTGETVEAGVCRAGAMVTMTYNPRYGISESKRDFSIKKELSNGAWYTRKRDIVRTFSCSILGARATDFYELGDIYDNFGPDPFACLLADGVNDFQWTVFGRMDNPYTGSHDYPDDSTVNVNITEAV